jgi:hypothetical protein
LDTGLYYLATIKHTARQCPGVESDTFKDFLARFSSEQLAKANARILGAYIDQSCITRIVGVDHVTTFALEADSASKVKDLLGSMGTEVRQVVSWEAGRSLSK